MRIDAHQHFWRYDPAEYDWIDDSMGRLKRDFSPADLKQEMSRAGVDRSIAVQARQTIQETRWLLDLADEHPFIAGVVGWVDLQSPDVDVQLEQLAAHPRLLGVRHIVQAEGPGFLSSAEFRRGLGRLERYGLTYDVLVYARQLPEVLNLVRAFPKQRFVLDHLGKPDVKGAGFQSWRPYFEELASFPQVWCKLSGLVTEADWRTWTAEQLRPYIEAALEYFGADRLMVGSDWPVCTLASPYMRTLEIVEDALAGCSSKEQASVFGGTAQHLWNL
jgi:L-fuconolactonase